MDSEVEHIVSLISDGYGEDISSYDPSFIMRIINSRAESLTINNSAYLDLLKNSKEESNLFIKSLNINFSIFFRNTFTYSVLDHVVIPLLLRSKSGREIRVWSAACSSGEEPYSIAMIFDELTYSQRAESKFRIIATDINKAELESAKRAIYPASSIENVSYKRVKSYFKKHNDRFSLIPEIKSYVDFSYFDLLDKEGCCPSASIFGNFDLIICSNILYYYKKEERARILDKVKSCMAPGAFLVTGEAERDCALGSGFYEFYSGSAIFKK
jgi:chemotaxis methyl-accepting protein methylase